MTYPCCSTSVCIPMSAPSRLSSDGTAAGGVCRSCAGSTRSQLVTAIAVGTLHTTPFTAAGWSATASDRLCDVLLHQHLIHGMARSTPNLLDQLTEGGA